MWDDPILAVPGTRRPRAEVEELRLRVEQRAARDPDDATAAGALAAARWTLRETPEAPLTAGRLADPSGVQAERDEARGVVLGLRPGDVDRAAGVRAWLEWWLEIAAFPAWLAPTRR